MKVLKDYNGKYWLFCYETGKFRNINRAGAGKVASVCEIEIEEYNTKDQFEIERNYLLNKYSKEK
jgi:hypothetical protein